METSIKISLNSIIHEKRITLPANLEQLKNTYKQLFNLDENKLSKIKIYYMNQEKDKKIKIETEQEYMNLYLEEHPDLIQAELDNDIIEMVKPNNTIQTPNLPEVDNHNCFRCLEKDCFLIPYISLNKDKDNNFIVNYKCRNNHKGENISMNNYKSFLNKKLEDILCHYCSSNKEKDKSIRVYYCYKCKKYICNLEKCNNNHEKQCDNNGLIQLENLDSYCILHGRNLIYYCEDCNMSFCNLCKSHEGHEKKIIGEMSISEEEKKMVIDRIEQNLKELEIIYNNIKENLINKLSKIYEMNKNILALNKKIIENLNKNETNGEIYRNFNNCKYIKEIKLKDNLDYYNNIFKQIENFLSDEFFEFDEEKRKSKLYFWNKIPLVISFHKDLKKILKNKKMEVKKLLANPKMTMANVSSIIRKEMKNPERSLFFLINKKISVNYEITLKEIYDKYKDDDGYLNLEAFTEGLFG